MRALLHHPALVKHGDFIAEPAGGQAVRNEYGRFIAHNFVEIRVHFGFGHGIERGGRLIEHDEGRVLIERAGQRDFLRLAAGNLHAFGIEVPVQRGI